MFSKIWLVLVAIVIIALLWVGIPYLGSAFHLNRGARALTEQGDPQAAVTHLENAVRLDPDNAQAYRWLREAYVQTGQPDKALQAAQSALDLAPDNFLARLELGDVYDLQGDFRQAIANYEAWDGHGREQQLVINYLKLADDLWNSGDQEAAIDIWRDQVFGSGYADLYAAWRLAQVYEPDSKSGRFYLKQVTRFPLESIEFSADPRLMDFQLQAVTGFLDQGLWDQETKLNVLAYQAWRSQSPSTRQALETLAAEMQDDPDLWYYLGEHYRRVGLPQPAYEAYQQAAALDPDYALAHLRMGMLEQAQFEQSGSVDALDGARLSYQTYHELVPSDPFALHLLSNLCRLHECPDNPWLVQLHQSLAERQPEYKVNQEMDGGWVLLGYDLDEARLTRNEPVPLWLYWSAPPDSLSADYGDDLYPLDDGWVQILPQVHNMVLSGNFELGQQPIGFPRVPFGAETFTDKLVRGKRNQQPTTMLLFENGQDYETAGRSTEFFQVQDDAAYLQSGWLRSDSGKALLGQRWRGDSPARAYNDYVGRTERRGKWGHYVAIVFPRSSVTEGRVDLRSDGSEAQNYFDNVVFIEIEDLLPLRAAD